jgi:LmbE family N-acetylglucosaminyl deacetylase
VTTVVMFHAHPDDEAILTGGTIASLSGEGHRVVLVVATRGELGEEPPGLLATGQDLAHRRAAETKWSAEILGIQRVEFLGYRDSGMPGRATNSDGAAFCNADVGQAASRLAAIVRDERASLLVIYDDHGGYGHPDHVQVHRVGTRAAAMVPGVALYEATMNRDHLQRGLELLAGNGGGALDVDLPELDADFGEPAVAITHTIDVTPYVVHKRRAMAAHASQIAETSFFLRLPEHLFAAGFGLEWFIDRSSAVVERPTVLDRLRDASRQAAWVGSSAKEAR